MDPEIVDAHGDPIQRAYQAPESTPIVIRESPGWGHREMREKHGIETTPMQRLGIMLVILVILWTALIGAVLLGWVK